MARHTIHLLRGLQETEIERSDAVRPLIHEEFDQSDRLLHRLGIATLQVVYLGVCEHRFLAEEGEDLVGLQPLPEGGSEPGEDTMNLLILQVSLEVVW